MTIDEISEEAARLCLRQTRTHVGWFQLTNKEYEQYGEDRYEIEDLTRAILLHRDAVMCGFINAPSKYGQVLIKYGFAVGVEDILHDTDKLTTLYSLLDV